MQDTCPTMSLLKILLYGPCQTSPQVNFWEKGLYLVSWNECRLTFCLPSLLLVCSSKKLFIIYVILSYLYTKECMLDIFRLLFNHSFLVVYINLLCSFHLSSVERFWKLVWMRMWKIWASAGVGCLYLLLSNSQLEEVGYADPRHMTNAYTGSNLAYNAFP